MNILSIILTGALAFPCFCHAGPSDAKMRTLYNSLDPSSVSQHLAFYELYSNAAWGQKALSDAWKLLAGNTQEPHWYSDKLSISPTFISTLVSLVNKPIDQELVDLDQESIEALLSLSSRLPHYTLKGHHVWNEEDILKLPLEEIDLARGLFISQFGNDRRKIQSYEALIDLMALQIRAKLPKNAKPEEKITLINSFIFDEMGFRFPPHSLYAKNIDLYTFLPSVLDSRRGVCLGVSILYLCIAQRLSLPLEMITPPGHIFVRYREGDTLINIETTARGVNIQSDEYLSINTCQLQQRNIREVIGMAHFNQASVFWQNGEYEKALSAYQKAEPYMSDDPVLKELMGYILLLTGNTQEGERLLRLIKDHVADYEIIKNTVAEDYLLGHVDAKGISVLFSRVDEDRKSILAKKEKLERIIQEYPQFRSGLLSLAVTWIQLHRLGEALEVLERFHSIDASDPEVHYYLSVLYGMRYNYPQSWYHLQQAETILKKNNHHPKILREIRRELLTNSPEYLGG